MKKSTPARGNHVPADNIPTQLPVDEDGVAETEAGEKSGFPIVGIGASAGGLAALEAFFSGMPAARDPDMAFVVVQHLAPVSKRLEIQQQTFRHNHHTR